jgi:subtilisin family serine protease
MLTLLQAAAIVEAGIFLGVAAGNEATLADYSSPASEPSACTVGATAINETLVWWSNFGPIVDILAPGVNITSTWIGEGTEILSGTVSNSSNQCAYGTCADILHHLQSMATPHVVGLAAYFSSVGLPIEGLCETIADLATKGAIDESTLHEGTPNLLAYNTAEGKRSYGRRTVWVA